MAIRLTWVKLSSFALYNTNLQNTESKTHPRIWFLKCFLGFWEVFSYSWKCFWNLGVCLDSGKCFATIKLSCLFLVNWKDLSGKLTAFHRNILADLLSFWNDQTYFILFKIIMLVSTFHVIQSVPFQLGYRYTYNFSYNFFCCSLGILQREQEQSVVYGSVDSGKSISSHDKFLELVIKEILLITVSSKMRCIFMVV